MKMTIESEGLFGNAKEMQRARVSIASGATEAAVIH
jgi:hypothetical protein